MCGSCPCGRRNARAETEAARVQTEATRVEAARVKAALASSNPLALFSNLGLPTITPDNQLALFDNMGVPIATRKVNRSEIGGAEEIQGILGNTRVGTGDIQPARRRTVCT